MEQMRVGFEMALKNKLAQKTNSLQGEEVVLMKSCRYFDGDNDGLLSMTEWFKVIEKIGVIVPGIEDLRQLFKYYDTTGKGKIDYKEFSDNLFKRTPAKPKTEVKEDPEDNSRIEELLLNIRANLAERGVRGIIGFGRQFRIMDDKCAKTIEFPEFKKVICDYRLGINDEDIRALFKSFDVNKTGSVDYEEFLRIIRGKMSEYRVEIIKKVFESLDRAQAGAIDIEDLKNFYNPRRHPDVLNEIRTEDEVLLEFLESVDAHHNSWNENPKERKIFYDEFEEYFGNVSITIADDSMFASMMRSVWRFEEEEKSAPIEKKVEEEKRPFPKPTAKASQKPEPSPISKKDTSPIPYKTSSPNKKGIANMSSIDNTLNLGAKLHNQLMSAKLEKTKVPPLETILSSLRKKLAARGPRGIIGLARHFHIIDDRDTGVLGVREFAKAINEYRIDIDEPTQKALYAAFDKEGDGNMLYKELLKGIVGPVSGFRKKLIQQAFKKLDVEGSGIVEFNDVKGVYNAKGHPDVRAGRKTEDEVLGEFLETLEMHHSLNYTRSDHQITQEEFEDYYYNVSSSIEDDKYFEQLMTHAWRLVGEDSKKSPWKEGYSSSSKGKQLTVTQAAPFGTTEVPTDYSSWLRPKPSPVPQREEKKAIPPAGYPSWPTYERPKTGHEEALPKTATPAKGDLEVIEAFKKSIINRGTRGIFGLQRSLKIIDTDNSGRLSLPELKKLVKDYRMKISEADCEKLFRVFDKENTGVIYYEGLLKAIVGEMNQFRKNLVTKVYKTLDKSGNGEITVDDLKELYNASRHPDVLTKKKTEDDSLSEFFDTFEEQYYFVKPGSKAGIVSLDEFIDYYNNISASIADDKYFDLMISNVWNLSKVAYGKGWGA